MPDCIRPARRALLLRCADTLDKDVSRYGSAALEKMDTRKKWFAANSEQMNGTLDTCRVDVVGVCRLSLHLCGCICALACKIPHRRHSVYPCVPFTTLDDS